MKDMEFKSQIATTREQSERLLALGIKPETADMYWYEDSLLVADWSQIKSFQDYPPEDKTDEFYPAWSLSRLKELMPEVIYINKVDDYRLTIYGNILSYSYFLNGEHVGDLVFIIYKDSIFEGMISIISWLIERGYLNKTYLK
jgi:hypothetical protein